MNYNHPMLPDSSGARQDAASVAVEELNGSNDALANTIFADISQLEPSNALAEIDLWIASNSSQGKPSEVLVETPQCEDVSQPHTSNFLPQVRSRSIASFGDLEINREVQNSEFCVASSSSRYKPSEVLVEVPQCGDFSQLHSSNFLPQVRSRSSASFDDLDINKEVQNYEFCVLGNGKTRPSTLKMVDNVIFTKRMCDILIKVVGAQGGHVVKAQLRYMTGAHENIPVNACKKHSDSIDPHYAFYIPKVPLVETLESKGGHLTRAIPVPNLPAEERSFTFPLLFRCWNSCHREYGKRQELVLTLCDRQNKVLKESHFDVRVYASLTREFDTYCEMLKEAGQEQENKKHSGEETKEPAPKRAKQEVEEGSVGMQAGEAGTPTPRSCFPPHQGGRIRGQVELDPAYHPLVNELMKVSGGRVSWIEWEEEVDGASSDPPSNSY